MAFYSAALVTAAALTIYSCGSVAMTVEQKWLAQTGGGMEAEEQGLFSQAYSVPDQIVGSVERMDEGFLFQIPADTPFPEKLDIHIAGVCIIWKRRTGIGCLERPISFQQIRLVRN